MVSTVPLEATCFENDKKKKMCEPTPKKPETETVQLTTTTTKKLRT
jgi:hypothetical protein